MQQGDRLVARCEPLRQPLGHRHRAVAAAGAAQRDGQVGLAFAAVVRQQAVEQRGQLGEKRRESGIGRDEAIHDLVAPGERAQVRLVMRVLQEAHIEHQVGLARQPVAVGEGGHADGHLRAAAPREMSGQDPAQLRRRERRGVDHQVGPRPQRHQQIALGGDPVDDRPAVGERMAAAGLGVAAAQDAVLAVEEDHGQAQAGATQITLQVLDEGRGGEAPGADIDPQGERAAAALDQRPEQVEGQVVDRLVAEILEDRERRRAAGPGHARDQNQRPRPAVLAARGRLPGALPGSLLGVPLARRGRALVSRRVRPGRRAPGEVRQGQAQLGRRRRLEGIEAHQGQLDAENRAARALRHAFDARAGHQVHHQGDGHVAQGLELGDAEPAHLDPAADRVGRPRQEHAVGQLQFGAVVGHQAGALVEQPQRQVGLAGARGPAQQHAERIGRAAARRCEAASIAWRHGHATGVNQLARHDFSRRGNGRRTTKRAPLTARLTGSMRFSAWIVPPCASTIWREIDSPSPEWVPNFSPLGRSL